MLVSIIIIKLIINIVILLFLFILRLCLKKIYSARSLVNLRNVC